MRIRTRSSSPTDYGIGLVYRLLKGWDSGLAAS
jgi:hypothetical protein